MTRYYHLLVKYRGKQMKFFFSPNVVERTSYADQKEGVLVGFQPTRLDYWKCVGDRQTNMVGCISHGILV
jgi:hypothetical protein